MSVATMCNVCREFSLGASEGVSVAVGTEIELYHVCGECGSKLFEGNGGSMSHYEANVLMIQAIAKSEIQTMRGSQ